MYADAEGKAPNYFGTYVRTPKLAMSATNEKKKKVINRDIARVCYLCNPQSRRAARVLDATPTRQLRSGAHQTSGIPSWF